MIDRPMSGFRGASPWVTRWSSTRLADEMNGDLEFREDVRLARDRMTPASLLDLRCNPPMAAPEPRRPTTPPGATAAHVQTGPGMIVAPAVRNPATHPKRQGRTRPLRLSTTSMPDSTPRYDSLSERPASAAAASAAQPDHSSAPRSQAWEAMEDDPPPRDRGQPTRQASAPGNGQPRARARSLARRQPLPQAASAAKCPAREPPSMLGAKPRTDRRR